MISAFTLTLFLKMLAVGRKLNLLPIYYDKGTCRLKNTESKERLKWLTCFFFNHLFGQLQISVFFWRAFVDHYPVSLLLLELVVPIGYGLYSLFALKNLAYENEMKILLNQMLDTNSKLKRLFWISNTERDGLELFLCSYFYNVASIIFFRVIMSFLFDRFNNLYAYYLFKMGPEYDYAFLKYSYYLWDWFTTSQILITSTTSAVIFFIFVHSNKLWCKRMMNSLMYIEFQPRTAREQFMKRYRMLQINHRLFSYVMLQKVFPLALAGCTMDLIVFIFIIIKFFNKLALIAKGMIGTVILTVAVAVWVVLNLSVQMTKSSQQYLRIFGRHRAGSKLGKVIYLSLEPLFVRIGFAYTATESTVLTLFRIVLESVVNLLIAVD